MSTAFTAFSSATTSSTVLSRSRSCRSRAPPGDPAAQPGPHPKRGVGPDRLGGLQLGKGTQWRGAGLRDQLVGDRAGDGVDRGRAGR